MSNAAAIVADVRHAIELLGEGDAKGARVAQALNGWLRGTDFEASLGLEAGWRQVVHQKAREVALDALVARHPDLSGNALADLIVEGVKRAASCIDGARPDGKNGYFQDLARADCKHSARHWRRLIAEAGHQSS